MKTVAIVQARYASTRLPGKILKRLPYDGRHTALQQVIKRLKRSKVLDDVVVATTDHKEDDSVAALCIMCGFTYYRGSMDDVLSRYHGAALEAGADIVVRVTSDCPCIDVDIIDAMLAEMGSADYISNVNPRIFPHGLDAEAFTFAALDEAHKKANQKYEREHVTPYIINGNFKHKSYQPAEHGGQDIRITLDRPEDYTMLCAVYDNLYAADEFFGYKEIMKLFASKPWLKEINANIIQKRKYENLADEIKDAVKMLRMQELNNAADKLEKIK